jgi:hypothetical protein
MPYPRQEVLDISKYSTGDTVIIISSGQRGIVAGLDVVDDVVQVATQKDGSGEWQTHPYALGHIMLTVEEP